MEKNSIITEENIKSESSSDLNFKKIFEHCNVEWLQNLQKEINKNFKYIEKIQKRRKPKRKCRSLDLKIFKKQNKK